MWEGVPDFGQIDGSQSGTFSFRDVVAREDEVQNYPLSFLY